MTAVSRRDGGADVARPRMTAPDAQAVFGVEVDAPDGAAKKGNHGSPFAPEAADAEARR